LFVFSLQFLKISHKEEDHRKKCLHKFIEKPGFSLSMCSKPLNVPKISLKMSFLDTWRLIQLKESMKAEKTQLGK
jgi:hypothetical protein